MKEQTQDAGNDRELPLPELAGKTVSSVEVVASGDEDAPGAVESYVVLHFTDGSTLYAGDEPTAYRAIPATPAIALGPLDDDEAFAASPEEIAEAAETAYMADDYGPDAFRRIAKFLLDKGHSAYEAEAILRSKHLRWADDSQGRGVGRKTTSAAFIRYYEASRTDWTTEARTLVAESSLTLRDEA